MITKYKDFLLENKYENIIIAEAYDDVQLEYIKNQKKLSEYTDYDDKTIIGNYTYINKIDTDDDWYLWGDIKVFDNEDGTEIANATYGKQYEYSNMHPTIDVRSDKRRQGIASNIYEWIEELTNDTLYPDLPHTDSASKLWSNHNRKFGKK